MKKLLTALSIVLATGCSQTDNLNQHRKATEVAKAKQRISEASNAKCELFGVSFKDTNFSNFKNTKIIDSNTGSIRYQRITTKKGYSEFSDIPFVRDIYINKYGKPNRVTYSWYSKNPEAVEPVKDLAISQIKDEFGIKPIFVGGEGSDGKIITPQKFKELYVDSNIPGGGVEYSISHSTGISECVSKINTTWINPYLFSRAGYIIDVYLTNYPIDVEMYKERESNKIADFIKNS